ncbi:hypothetical protein N8T08_000130 [Aspergillus melleus]|uniref:Uncharacterized protein n=1 Tax=Aspergillus melleus TaxID=138277 RepID=A0ACC3BHD2_9EURO|nr:hypothetical protein N8T08_000130 [Aspergillus melleus]
MLRALEGKFGIVTGGSRGIGEAIARNLAEKGCSLLLNFTSESSRARTEDLCASLAKDHSVRCVSVQADLNQPEAGTSTILLAAKQHFSPPDGGDFRIDILINNAGVSADRLLNDPVNGPIDPAYFTWHYNVNVLAPLLLTQAVAPYLPRGAPRTGRIVNISSVSSSLGFAGQTVYGGTKAALEAMTRTWARELADRATVNAINPGPVIGDMYFLTGEGFWNQIQGFQDNTPLSELVDSDPQLESLTPEQVRLVKEKMGGRRPAFTGEVAGVVVRVGASRSLARTVPVAQALSPTSITTSASTPRALATSSGKTPADEIVEELQELYENAKDEFEIATDSTDGGTIYAASDRESARDALNQLLIVFELYTQDHSPTQMAVRAQVRAETEEGRREEGAGEGEDEGQVVETNFDPSAVEPEVREEVKKRVAQRVRELKNAVELLEERAMTE